MAIWALGGLMGPVVGPLAGSYLSAAKGWRWAFWLITILGGAITVALILILRETYAPVLLERKARRISKETGRRFTSKLEKTSLSSGQFMVLSLVRPIKMLIFSPIVLLLSLYMAVVYG